jgi:hypothetical protein
VGHAVDVPHRHQPRVMSYSGVNAAVHILRQRTSGSVIGASLDHGETLSLLWARTR